MHVVELGAGLGHLARLLRVIGVSRTHLILDLPESLVYSCAFLTTTFPKASFCLVRSIDEARNVRLENYDFVFVPSCYAEVLDLSGRELFVNTASLGEMRNETIQYWMDFVQRHSTVRHLFTQNRFLNSIDPTLHAWRWNENEASVHYDASWTILKWELEPIWYRCPYIAPIAARHLDIAATRRVESSSQDRTRQVDAFLRELMLQDWCRFPDRPGFMTMHQRPFVTDVTMQGALFKLWESVRLKPCAETAALLLRYLDHLLEGSTVTFEETRYYEQLFLAFQDREQLASLREYEALVRRRRNEASASARLSATVKLVQDTRDFNIVSLDLVDESGMPVLRFAAVSKSLGPIDLYSERVGQRELPPHLLLDDDMERLVVRARHLEV